MDLQGNSQPESGKLEQIVSQFLLKSLHIILDSRVPSRRPHGRSGDLSSASHVRKSDKWFNLVLGDRPAALDNLSFWHRNLMEPMIIDVILVHEGSKSMGGSVETVIERWVVQYENPRVVAAQTRESSALYKKAYKKSIILLRALYSQMRLLPAYKIFRQLSRSSQTYNFDIIYKVPSFGDPFSRVDEEMMEEHSFNHVEAFPGRLCISVAYHKTLTDFNLEPSTSLPPKIITDYVGSPNTDPLRFFPSLEKGVRAISFPLRAVRAPFPVPFQRPHSWTSGFHREAFSAQNQPVVGSPPAYRPSALPYDCPSPPTDIYSNRVPNYRMPIHQRTISYDGYQLSPPFSPSPSPSSPSYVSTGNHPMRTRVRPETAPVSIPLSMASRNSRYLSPNYSDPSRISLPPLSPRSRKTDPSSQESPCGTPSFRKIESLRSGEMQNHYAGQKMIRDSKDDSGRFSGLLSSSGSPRIGFSRSSSRLSFQDDLDDNIFSCPFDVDDVDTLDIQVSQNFDGKKASEFTSQSLPIVKKSQDAAVGVLVHMLRTAPPLRQDSCCYSSHSMKTELAGGVPTASGFFMPRKTADALEELRSFREMKDLLLSKSGTRVVSKDDV
ncbi:autophagy-related protein 13a-like [Juglans regia]|uniref:Autophagy-related protein 13a-like n=2 Tax=Juglans regia TaxID=51240 RepID=A0A2I4F8Y9_JUGRE|nr:autophagy-related protein 13a-like [Juglans regia]XP_035540159.1 autophagy-related protein 13a-like [Juglans regia]XP_035540160.1 autophagy-related protein 13a-like [Juglans regia]XP_035540161.1 autophagy-related protein 13a-like [Juglans regia]